MAVSVPRRNADARQNESDMAVSTTTLQLHMRMCRYVVTEWKLNIDMQELNHCRLIGGRKCTPLLASSMMREEVYISTSV